MPIYCQRCFIVNPKRLYPEARTFCQACPEDRRLLCDDCSASEHRFNTVSQYHAVEAIDPEYLHGWHLLAPFADLVVAALALFIIVRYVGYVVQDSYLQGKEVCPLVDGIRGWTFWLDSGFVYAIQTHFANGCVVEDGYWRFHIDAWVRGVISHNDTWFLFSVTLGRAILMRFTIKRFVIDPLLAAGSALLHTICYGIDAFLLPGDVRRMLASAGSPLIILFDRLSPPTRRIPPTLARTRPPMHFMDAICYFIGRRTRVVRYCFQEGLARVESCTRLAMLLAVLTRVLCLLINFGAVVRWTLRLVGLGEVLAAKQARYGAMIGFGDVASRSFLGSLAGALGSYFRMLCWLLLCCSPLLVLLGYHLVKSRNAYYQQEREETGVTVPVVVKWPWHSLVRAYGAKQCLLTHQPGSSSESSQAAHPAGGLAQGGSLLSTWWQKLGLGRKDPKSD